MIKLFLCQKDFVNMRFDSISFNFDAPLNANFTRCHISRPRLSAFCRDAVEQKYSEEGLRSSIFQST